MSDALIMDLVRRIEELSAEVGRLQQMQDASITPSAIPVDELLETRSLKIGLIKLVRSATKKGLRESKEMVDNSKLWEKIEEYRDEGVRNALASANRVAKYDCYDEVVLSDREGRW